MSSSAQEIERAVEQVVREISSANRDLSALLGTIRQIENIAAAADQLDLRSAFSTKSDLNALQSQIDELARNARTLDRELSNASSQIRRALY